MHRKAKHGILLSKAESVRGGDRDKTPYSVNQTLYLTPDTKTIQRNMYSALIPAGTEFLFFSSEEERNKYFGNVDY